MTLMPMVLVVVITKQSKRITKPLLMISTANAGGYYMNKEYDTTGLMHPKLETTTEMEDTEGTDYHYSADGITYHQWLIGMAMQGLCANPVCGEPLAHCNYDNIAEMACNVVEATLKEYKDRTVNVAIGNRGDV